MIHKITKKIKWHLYEKKEQERFLNEYRSSLRSEVVNKDFSIIASNCWGGGIYEDLSLPYLTPTVGLAFYPSCYIKFITNLRSNLEKPINFIESSKYHQANEIRKKSKNPYPIGLIDDIEIHFIHYLSTQEAREKWGRRKDRVNFDNLFFAFNDRDFCTEEQIKLFDSTSYKNKVCFTAKDYTKYKSTVWLKEYASLEQVEPADVAKVTIINNFKIADWLNGKL
jgi:uncharacterized protein (DUF1919 family)